MKRLVSRLVRRVRRRLHPEQVAIEDFAATVDPAWYLAEYPDVAASGLDPAIHFARTGIRTGHRPNRFVDPDWYASLNPDIGGTAPLLHYALVGRLEHRDPGPAFGAREYLSAYPDLAGNGTEPLEHYIRHGRAEGRVLFRSPLAARAASGIGTLSAGLSAQAAPGDAVLFVPDETLVRIFVTFEARGVPLAD